MKNKVINNILAMFSVILFVIILIKGIDSYIKGVALILLSINFWIDVDINSITNVILPGRGGAAEHTTNKKIAVTTSIGTVIFWIYLILEKP